MGSVHKLLVLFTGFRQHCQDLFQVNEMQNISLGSVCKYNSVFKNRISDFVSEKNGVMRSDVGKEDIFGA